MASESSTPNLKAIKSSSQLLSLDPESPLLEGDDPPEPHTRMPEAFRRSPWATAFSLTGDLVLLCLWLAIGAFTVEIARCGGVPKAEFAFGDETLSQARIIVPTLFPILFAAALGRCVKLFSMYQVQQGERLSILDQLLGSTTLGGTVITTAGGNVTLVATLLLLVLWSMSPLGSQASFRSFYWQTNVTETPTVFPYLDASMSKPPGMWGGKNIPLTFINSLFTSSLAISQSNAMSRSNANSPMDVWGNTKIPSVAALSQTRRADKDGWYTVGPVGVDSTEYSSLIGIPVGIGGETTNSFARVSLEAEYWTLQCPLFETFAEYPTGLPANYTSSAMDVWTEIRNVSADWPHRARRIAFRLQDWCPIFMSCTIQTTYVEAEIICQRPACGVSKVRESRKSHPSPNITSLDYSDPHVPFNNPYLDNFVTAIPGHVFEPSTLTSYIKKMLGIPTDDKNCSVIIANPRGYESLLAQILNTYLMASIEPEYIVDHQNIADQDIPPDDTKRLKKATGVTWSGEPIFTHSKPWLALLFVATLVALSACIANMILSLYLVCSPELLMNFTTIARHSPFVVGLPAGASALSDSDLGRLIKDSRVRFGNVAAGEPVGHIALGTAGRVVALEKSRLYD